MKIKNYYQILGVDKTASSKQIRDAYLKLIRKHHPDLAKNHYISQQKIQDIIEAYNILGDLENRLRYSIIMNQKENSRHKWAKKYNLPVNFIE